MKLERIFYFISIFSIHFINIFLDIILNVEYIIVVKKLTLYILFIFAVSTSFAGAFLEFFQAKSENSNIKLEWKTSDESNVQSFVIERRTAQSNTFSTIQSISPKGSNSYYSFVDEAAYKEQDVVFSYRLKIVDNNGTATYSAERYVSHSISGVKRTWGTIKAMFR